MRHGHGGREAAGTFAFCTQNSCSSTTLGAYERSTVIRMKYLTETNVGQGTWCGVAWRGVVWHGTVGPDLAPCGVVGWYSPRRGVQDIPDI